MWPVSTTFAATLAKPVFTIRIKAEVLDDNNNPVPGGTFYDSKSPFIQNFITDGSVDLDIGRGTRRTFTMTLLNNNGQFSPGSSWTGLFYVNRRIRIWRGLDYGGTAEFVPIGTFMIDHADVVVEQNMSVVVLSGSDLMKKMAKSMFTDTKTYPKGTSYNTIIRDFCTTSGIGHVSLDPLNNRSTTAQQINTALTFNRGQYRGEELVKLLDGVGIEAFFDPLGTFVSRDFTDPTQFPTVFKFQSGPGGLLLTAKASFNDDALYNHALVVATGAKNAVYTAEKKDTNPTSPTNINAIGDRVFKYESSLLSTQAEADAAVIKVFYDNVLLSEDIELDVICHPALEGGDVVYVYEPTYSKLDQKIRLTSFSIPLASTRMTVKGQRVIKLT